MTHLDRAKELAIILSQMDIGSEEHYTLFQEFKLEMQAFDLEKLEAQA